MKGPITHHYSTVRVQDTFTAPTHNRSTNNKFISIRYNKKALMFRDWGRIGNNSEEMSERFGSSVDGIPYDGKFLYGVVGYNMKACEMNAAFGLAQLLHPEQ